LAASKIEQYLTLYPNSPKADEVRKIWREVE
jgi:outer membrane protein assembly factor BamD (BamD/ComL family)